MVNIKEGVLTVAISSTVSCLLLRSDLILLQKHLPTVSLDSSGKGLKRETEKL